MKTIILKSTNLQFFIELKVDIMAGSDNFTIMQISNKSDAEVVAGFSLQELPLSITEMTEFATNLNVLMDIVDIDPQVATINQVDSVTALNITTTGAMTGGNVGINYHQQVEVEGGNGPFTFGSSGGDLPIGTTLDPVSGFITGIPTTVESTTFTITVTDAFTSTDTEVDITIEIAA